MSQWEIKKVEKENINGGLEYMEGDFLYAVDINAIVNNVLWATDYDSEPTQGSEKALTSGGAYDALSELTAAITTKAQIDSPTFSGTVIVPSATVVGAAVNKGQMDAAILNMHGIINPLLDLKANIMSPTFTGRVTVPYAIESTDAINKGQVNAAIDVAISELMSGVIGDITTALDLINGEEQ